MNVRSAPRCRIRPAQLSDQAVIHEAQAETARISYGTEASAEVLATQSARTDQAIAVGQISIAEDDAGVIGYFWVEQRSDVVWILDFYVASTRRGQGFASAMLTLLFERFAGQTDYRLVISDFNTPSLRFFLYHGAQCLDADDLGPIREYRLWRAQAMTKVIST